MKTLDQSDQIEMENGRFYALAYVIARLFDPLVTNFLVSMVFLLSVDQISWRWFLVLLVGDLLLPVSFLIFSLQRGKISDFDMTKRQERMPYYTIVAVCWSGTLLVLLLMGNIPVEILMMQTWLAVFGILNVGITKFWKISGHMMAATSLVLWLILLWSPAFLVLLFTLMPLLGWARWTMRKHTVAQLIAGVAVMLVVVPTIWVFYMG